jgi:hypothetical protein
MSKDDEPQRSYWMCAKSEAFLLSILRKNPWNYISPIAKTGNVANADENCQHGDTCVKVEDYLWI